MRTLLSAITWLGLISGLSLGAEADISNKVQFFNASGVKIAYSDAPPDAGHAEPVVLLQGFGGRLSHWKPMRDALHKAGYRVLAMDSRGHGQSDKPHDPDLYGQEMADDVARLLDHLRLRRAHIIGYSMGGDIANRVRERHPSRVITVTMGGVGRGVAKGWTTSEFNVIKVAESLERGEGMKSLFREPGGAGTEIPSEAEIEKLNARFMEGQDPLALAAVIRAYARLEVSEESLKDNLVPTLVIVGEDDPEKPTVDELKRVMKNMRTVIIPGVDHSHAAVKPEFLRATVEFLEAHRDR